MLENLFSSNDKRDTKRKSITEITKAIVAMREDLIILEEEKTGHLMRLEKEKHELEIQMQEAADEKQRGQTIFKNLTALLGGEVSAPKNTTIK